MVASKYRFQTRIANFIAILNLHSACLNKLITTMLFPAAVYFDHAAADGFNIRKGDVVGIVDSDSDEGSEFCKVSNYFKGL